MKSNLKFFAGLGLGLIISFLFLNVGTLQSKNNISEPGKIVSADDNPAVDGEMISTAIANPMISLYSTDFVTGNNLPVNTTTGGVIGRKMLRGITGSSSDDLIKYSFYLTTEANGDQKIGLIFYPKTTSNMVLRTGTAAFCPNMCK